MVVGLLSVLLERNVAVSLLLKSMYILDRLASFDEISSSLSTVEQLWTGCIFANGESALRAVEPSVVVALVFSATKNIPGKKKGRSMVAAVIAVSVSNTQYWPVPLVPIPLGTTYTRVGSLLLLLLLTPMMSHLLR